MIRKIIFLLVLCFLCFHLFSEIEVLECQKMGSDFPGETLLKTDPTAIKLSMEAQQAIDSAKKCLPTKMKEDVENFLASTIYKIQLVCDYDFFSTDDCAEAWDPHFHKEGSNVFFKFTAAAIPMDYAEKIKTRFCGCIQGTLLHELIHLATLVGEEGHKEIEGCEKKCTKTITWKKKPVDDCIKHPPNFGKECDCADFPKKR